MLNSGAGIPVWCTGIDTLIDAFPNVILRQDLKGILSGFGSQFEVVDVFYIPKIEICNCEISIIFNDFYLPVINKPHFGADLIVPSSMFKNSNIILSQLKLSDNKKKLIIQYQTEYYKAQYTVRYLSVEGISTINKILKSKILQFIHELLVVKMNLIEFLYKIILI